MILNIISFVIALIFCFGDIYTSYLGKKNGLTEKTPRYRDANGFVNLTRLTVEKIILFAVALIISLVIYSYAAEENKQFAFFPLLGIGIMHLAITIQNYTRVQKAIRRRKG